MEQPRLAVRIARDLYGLTARATALPGEYDDNFRLAQAGGPDFVLKLMHPARAVVTTAEIARSFDDGMEFFSSFGGNPVACAAGLAVLDVLKEEALQRRALRLGERLLSGLLALQQRHPLIGDVRGSGLFLGVELVKDRALLTPATAEAGYVANRLRERGILSGTDGPHQNVLKLRPPLVIGDGDVDALLLALDDTLSEDACRLDEP